MSTKTLRKRVALVAVAALGFGLVSGTPANATGSATNYTSSLSLSWPSLTVVDSDVTNNEGYFYVDTVNTKIPADAAVGTALPLQTGETITVSVSAAPLGGAVADLDITSVINDTTAATTAFSSATNTDSGGDESIIVDANDTAASPNSSFSTTSALNNEVNRYWFAVSASGAGSIVFSSPSGNCNSSIKSS